MAVQRENVGVEVNRQARRWWSVPILAGLGLFVAVTVTSISIAASSPVDLRWRMLSTAGWFAAYPDIDAQKNGLVAVVWTEGTDTSVKHNGPLRLAWVDEDSIQWVAVTLDDNRVFDAALAISGATAHVAWSRDKTDIYYTACSPPPNCASSQRIATVGPGGRMALQVDIALDDAGTPHVVWVEDDGDDVRRVYYTRKVGTTAWQNKEIVGGTESRDSEGPAITYANGFVHVAWTEWTAPNHQPDSEVRYCRWTAGEAVCDQLDVKVLATRFDDLLLARNPTIAADRSGNVYVVWDQLLDELESVQGRKTYAIGYAHSGDNGDNWRSPRTYLEGYVFGTDATPFVSGDGQDYKVEYVHYLRPHISLVTSATASVPVLGWHAEFKPAGSIDPGLAQVAVVNPHKVFWTYATEPGSDVTGRMYWKEKQGAPHFMTLSTDLCGEVAQTVDSATGRLAPVGDLNEILAGESSGSHLHAVYHEETGGGLWGTFYNNNGSYQCHKVNLPVMLRNTLGGG